MIVDCVCAIWLLLPSHCCLLDGQSDLLQADWGPTVLDRFLSLYLLLATYYLFIFEIGETSVMRAYDCFKLYLFVDQKIVCWSHIVYAAHWSVLQIRPCPTELLGRVHGSYMGKRELKYLLTGWKFSAAVPHDAPVRHRLGWLRVAINTRGIAIPQRPTEVYFV